MCLPAKVNTEKIGYACYIEILYHTFECFNLKNIVLLYLFSCLFFRIVHPEMKHILSKPVTNNVGMMK